MSMFGRPEAAIQLAAKEWNENQYKVVESFQAGSEGGIIYFIFFFAVLLLTWLAFAVAKRLR